MLYIGKVQLEDSISNIRRKYALQSIEIELSNGSMKELEEILKRSEWVENISFSEHEVLRVNVKNMQKAQLAIPGILSDRSMALKRFAIVESTLEDVFMKVVTEV